MNAEELRTEERARNAAVKFAVEKDLNPDS